MEIDKKKLAELRTTKQKDENEIANLRLDLEISRDFVDKTRIQQEIAERETNWHARSIEINTLVGALRELPHKSKSHATGDECFRLVNPELGIDPVDIMGQRAKRFYDETFYFGRSVDEQIAESLSSREPALLVSGNPLAGKSRALLEAFKKLRKTTILLTDMNKVEEHITLPNIQGAKVIAYIDDLDDKVLKFKDATNTLLRLFLQENFKLVASCRRGPELDRLRNDLDPDLYLLLSVGKIEIGKLSDEQINAMKRRSATQLQWPDFDGNIGSLIMPLQAMRNRFEALKRAENELPTAILLALKCHYYLSNFVGDRSTYATDSIWEFCERYLKKGSIRRPDWDEAVTMLISEEFRLNFIECDDRLIRTEEVYLDHSKKIIYPEHDEKRIRLLIDDLFKPYERRQFGFPCTVKDFGRLMNQTKVFADALLIFKQTRLAGLEPNHFLYTMLIDRAPDYPTAMGIFRQMRDAKVLPNDVTYGTLMRKAPDYAEALKWFKEMNDAKIRPNPIIFITLMGKAPDYSEALKWFEEMKEAKIRPTDLHYTALIVKAPDYPEALRRFSEMKKANLVPNDTIYNALIDKAPGYSDAVALIVEMKAAKIVPNVVTYGTLIDRSPDYSEALKWFEEMKEANITPNFFIFIALIGKAPDFSTAMSIFNEVSFCEIESLKKIDGALKENAKKDPIKTFAYIMNKYPVNEVFGNRLFDTIIQNVCLEHLDLQSFFDQYFAIIKGQADDIVYFYAARFEQLQRPELGLALLEEMKGRGFDYFNTRGNCLKISDPDNSMKMYKEAYAATSANSQKRIALNNMANLIYDKADQGRYPEAIEYCNEAINLTDTSSDFPYPTRLLYLLTIRMTPKEHLPAEIDRLKVNTPLGRHGASAIVNLIDDVEKKELFSKSYVPELSLEP
jgi:pentatricopeptide repeat protein